MIENGLIFGLLKCTSTLRVFEDADYQSGLKFF